MSQTEKEKAYRTFYIRYEEWDKKSFRGREKMENERERVNVHLNYVHTDRLTTFSRVDFCVFQYRISLSSSSPAQHSLAECEKFFKGENFCGRKFLTFKEDIFIEAHRIIFIIYSSFSLSYIYMINETFHTRRHLIYIRKFCWHTQWRDSNRDKILIKSMPYCDYESAAMT